MAGKDSGGMTGFVQNKNPNSQGTRASNAPVKKQSHDDLRIPTPKTTSAAANTAQARAVSKQDRAEAGSRNARRDSNDQKRFYESSLDESSVTSSTRRRGADAIDTVPRGQTNGHTSGVHAVDSTDEIEDDSVDEDLMNQEPRNVGGGNALTGPGGPLSKGAQLKLMEHRRSGAGLPNIAGDSYPPTTSGNPSIAESIETKPRESKRHAPGQVQGRSQQIHPMKASVAATTKQDHSQPSQAQVEVSDSRSTLQGGFIRNPQSKGAQSVEQEAVVGFQFGRPNNPQVAMRPSTNSREHPSARNAESRPAASSNTAHAGTVPSALGDVHTAPRHCPQSGYFPEELNGSSKFHHHTSKSQRKEQIPTASGQRADNQALQDEQYSDGYGGDHEEPLVGSTAQHGAGEPEENVLDYDHEELFNMDYQELKAQSFDSDPIDKVFEFADGQTITDLDSKVNAAAALSPRDQLAFFTSLPMEEWEQAGDWFITRFGQVLDKLKTNRRGTREAAKAYENDIENRYGAVSKKRKQIEDELNDMKESGGKVLQGTPKKPKTN